ncbi:roadblock/LC7 domain-containing protein [Streptomyces variabilis]
MANTETALKECLSSIDGATAAALVDYTSGMALGTLGGGKDFNLEVAAAGNTDVVRSKLRTMELLGIKEEIEDILITLNSQYHLIRLLQGRGGNGLFLYLVLDAGRANLAMARHQMRRIENELEV